MLDCCLLTQTVLLIKSENVYEVLSGKICLTYSNDSKFFNETNKEVIGKMKDEFGGVIVKEFAGLKSKMYSTKILIVKNVI